MVSHRDKTHCSTSLKRSISATVPILDFFSHDNVRYSHSWCHNHTYLPFPLTLNISNETIIKKNEIASANSSQKKCLIKLNSGQKLNRFPSTHSGKLCNRRLRKISRYHKKIEKDITQFNKLYKLSYPSALVEMETQLEDFLQNISSYPRPVDICDGVCNFIHVQLVTLAADLLDKVKNGHSFCYDDFRVLENSIQVLISDIEAKTMLTCEYLLDLCQSLQEIMIRPTRLLECMEILSTNSREEYSFDLQQRFETNTEKYVKEHLIEIESGGQSRFPGHFLNESELLSHNPNEHDFEEIKTISRGAYGIVILVKHIKSGHNFAMKKIRKSLLILRNQVDQVFTERDILTFNDNPFAVTLFCSFETAKHLCMVMQYVEGGDCAALLVQVGSFPVDLSRIYVAETVLALEYLHSYGIVHRDLKPDNLLITVNGHIKLTDFGLSKIGLMNLATGYCETSVAQNCCEFKDNQVFGTPEYIAPEVILRTGYGKPVDWWALGIILFEFLIGNVPYFGKTTEELFSHVVNETFQWPDNIKLPIEAVEMVNELLRHDPVKRLGTGGPLELKEHSFFDSLDWGALLYKKVSYIPSINDEDDLSCFDDRSDRFSDHESNDSEEIASDMFSSFSSRSPLYMSINNNRDDVQSNESSSAYACPAGPFSRRISLDHMNESCIDYPTRAAYSFDASWAEDEFEDSKNSKLTPTNTFKRPFIHKSITSPILSYSSTHCDLSSIIQSKNERLNNSGSQVFNFRKRSPSLVSQASARLNVKGKRIKVVIKRGLWGFGFRILALPRRSSEFLKHVVDSVNSNGPAVDAGITVGNVITDINGTDITRLSHVNVVQILMQSGPMLTLTIIEKQQSLRRISRKFVSSFRKCEIKSSNVSALRRKVGAIGISPVFDTSVGGSAPDVSCPRSPTHDNIPDTAEYHKDVTKSF